MRVFTAVILFFCLGMSKGFSIEKNYFVIDCLEKPGEEIEIFIQASENKGAPLLVILHGASDNKGLHSLSRPQFGFWPSKGYSVAAVSCPGFGRTSGKKDLWGPRTLKVVNQAVDFIKHKLDIADLGIIGYGGGGSVGLLLAAQRNDIRCVVSSNSLYDLVGHKFHSSPIMKAIISKGYDIQVNNNAALQARSPIYFVHSIDAPVLILHREKHPLVSEEEIRLFAEAMQDAGKDCSVSFLERKYGKLHQQATWEEFVEETEEWIDQHMLD